MTESALYKSLPIAATKLNHRVWRNEIGAAKYKNKSGDVYHVPYGIPGPGGSDMIGYTLLQITPDMIGKKLPIFSAFECKWKRKRATADQQKFLNHILSVGGIAGTVWDDRDYQKLVGA